MSRGPLGHMRPTEKNIEILHKRKMLQEQKAAYWLMKANDTEEKLTHLRTWAKRIAMMETANSPDRGEEGKP